jgi:hypothetical protein
MELIETIRQELCDIHRGRHFAQWRPNAVQRLESGLAALPPFDAYAETRISSGDGASLIASTRFGDWAVDRLVAGETPDAILAAVDHEIARNSATYLDVSPIFGVDRCRMRARRRYQNRSHVGGLAIVGTASNPSLDGASQPAHRHLLSRANLPGRTCLRYPNAGRGERQDREHQPDRDRVRHQVSLACLLAGTGEVALPISMVIPDRQSLFAGGDGNIASRPIAAYPVVILPNRGCCRKTSLRPTRQLRRDR